MASKIKVDISQVKNLGFDFHQMAEVGLRRSVERGLQLLREEVPKVTHNLAQGVTGDVEIATLTGRLSVSARTGRVGVEGGLLHLPSGETREISLRGRPAFDYAEAVARGTGVYGPKGAVIRPKSGKALLIPISGAPPTLNGKPQSYITSGGQTFIVRRFAKGRRPDPYDVRAAQRLENEIEGIWNRVVQAFADKEAEF